MNPLVLRTIFRSFVLLAALIPFGCGRGDRPPLGRVHGVVTLDGKPVEGLIVMFSPESGRPAAATTDSKGNYALEYSYGVKGAKVGKCRVNFEWPTASPGVPIDPKHGVKSELVADVVAGSNKFDWEVKSDRSRRPVKPVD
ncbi:hypothetical protein [Planctomicrobium sp. SH527]|uniref:hypothetical protein n=1 Tax=Planctomicrobium sp. SH527 TaxID=3448123 RepID=UPI003F5C98C4